MNRPSQALEAALLQAHAAFDRSALAALYEEAGRVAEGEGRLEAACFYWSHARVYALELGHPRAEALRALLAAHGREH